jgi:hypothetical protein
MTTKSFFKASIPTTEFINDFVDYTFSFYGALGIYPLGFTVEQIVLATKLYITCLDVNDEEFCGDTLDRERVRDIILATGKISGLEAGNV